MIKVKYKKINNVETAKEIFAFISDSVKNDIIQDDVDFPPLHEIYDILIENAQKKSNLQFYGEVYKTLLGIVVASEFNIYSQAVMINVLCVLKKYRKNGFAQEFLSEIEHIAKKRKAKSIRMAYSKSAKNLALKNGYKLKFEISFSTKKDDLAILVMQKLPLQQLDAKTMDGQNYILYSTDSVKTSLINFVTENIPTATAKYIFEKDL